MKNAPRVAQPRPAAGAQINWGDPITRGLVMLQTGAARDIAGKRFAAGVGGISLRPGRHGLEYVAASNASTGMQFASSPMRTGNGAGTGDFSYLVIAAPVASSTREFFVACGNGVQEFYFGANINVALTATSGNVSASTNAGGASGVTVAGAADGRPHIYIYTRAGTTPTTGTLYVDGVATSNSVTDNVQMWSSGSSDYVAGYSSANWGVSGGVALVVGWNRALSQAEARELTRNPWRVMAGRISGTAVGFATAGAYALTAEPGSYALSGQAAGLRAARQVAAAAGAYSLSGQAASLNKGQRLAADSGSYALAGQAAELRAMRTVAAAQGSYALTGQPANLLHGFRLTAAQGAYLLTGQAVALGLSRLISAAQGSYAIAGQAAGLLAARRLSAGQGSYELAGQAASLVYTQARAYTLSASHGTYVLTGQAAGLLATRRVVAGQGAYSIAGQAAALTRGFSVVAGQGAYALSGQAATLLRTWALAAGYGSYGLTGQTVTLTYSDQEAPAVLASLRAGVDGVRRLNDTSRGARLSAGRAPRNNGSTR